MHLHFEHSTVTGRRMQAARRLRRLTAITAEASEALFLGLSLGVSIASIVSIASVVLAGLVWYLPLARRCARQDLSARILLLLSQSGR